MAVMVGSVSGEGGRNSPVKPLSALNCHCLSLWFPCLSSYIICPKVLSHFLVCLGSFEHLGIEGDVAT